MGTGRSDFTVSTPCSVDLLHSRLRLPATSWRRPLRAACKKDKAKLIIAKLDRLSRNLAFIATLMDSGVEFIAVDNPHANKLTVHILAAVAQK